MLLPGVRGLSFAPSVLLFRFRVGVEKAGREPVVWFSPRFFFFSCVERTTGLEPAASTLGGWCSGLVSYVRSVFPGCSLAFASCALFARVRVFCLRWGVERMTGLEPATFTLARWRSTRLSYIRMLRHPVALARGGACLYSSRLRV